MELLLKKGQSGLRQDPLVLSLLYHVYRGGKYLGTGEYKLSTHGEGFYRVDALSGINTILPADEWVLLKKGEVESIGEKDPYE